MALILRNVIRAALMALLVATSAGSAARAADATEIVKQVEAKYASVKSLKAKFVQTTKSGVFGDEKTSGDLIVARPSKMRWAFGSEKLFVTDGKKMWIYTAEEKQVIEYDDISGQRSTADALLTSLDKLNEHFKIDLLSSTADAHELMLKPIVEGQFKAVRLTLDKELMVRTVVITDTFDNVTELQFSEVKLNAPMDESVFSFVVPAGVDVVKATN